MKDKRIKITIEKDHFFIDLVDSKVIRKAGLIREFKREVVKQTSEPLGSGCEGWQLVEVLDWSNTEKGFDFWMDIADQAGKSQGYTNGMAIRRNNK